VTAGLRDDRDCLRLTATRESTSLINAVTGHVKSDQNHMSGNATNQELSCDWTVARRQYAARTPGINNQTTINRGARRIRGLRLKSPAITAAAPASNSKVQIASARRYPQVRHLKIPHANRALTTAWITNTKLTPNILRPDGSAWPIEAVLWTTDVKLSTNQTQASSVTTQCPQLTILLT
jgi:hypothetical protein